ncbi:MAG: HEAT-like repeat-containing protein [Deltaproteobacteria bacterium]|nr:HEAT-like repeat-containing protein [Deltaproteobacteria bacterium]
MTPENEKTFSAGSQISESEVRAVDEEYQQAKDLVNSFIKTLKAFRLYPADNPTLRGMQEQLFKRYQVYLEMYNSLTLQIDEYDFSFRGKMIYEDRDLKGSLPFLFFKDGLRELRFMEGIEEWELKGFNDIILQRDNINEFEDDLITLIWERDFIHISYAAIDPFLDETPVLIPESADQFRKNLRPDPLPESVREDFQEGGVGGEFDFERDFFEKGKSPLTAGASVYFLTSAELETLRKEVEGELNPRFVFQVVDVIFEVMGLEKEPEPYQDAIRILQKLLDALLNTGEFERAKEVLNRIHIIIKTYQLADWQAEAIGHFVETLGDAEHTQRIGNLLEKRTDLRLEDVSAYLLLLDRKAVPGLIKVLGDLNNSRGRRMLCDVICELASANPESVIPFMDDPRWYLVRNLVYILGRIGEESSLPYLQKAYNHNEPRVRREVVQAAGLIGGTRAMILLTKSLKDPDLRIRSMASINLARVGKKASLPALLEVIQAKDFPKRDPSEVKAFFDAVGSVGSNDALRPLKQILEQKGWFGGGIKDEVRLAAAGSLALIGSPEAKAILQAGADSREESIRRACLEAKRRFGI